MVNLEALARKIPVAGIRGSGGIDELEEEGYAVTCPFETSAIIKTLKGFMEGENQFPEKPFLWSTEQGAPKIIEIANRFMDRSLLCQAFLSKTPFRLFIDRANGGGGSSRGESVMFL